MSDAIVNVVVFFTFLLAGTVKGVIGMGLPTVSLALLTVAINLPSAMALLLVPSLVTNLWQALVGGNAIIIVRRIWPFLLLATLTVWIGALALSRIDAALLSALLGALIVVYALLNLAGYRIHLSLQQERWAGPLIGAVNGILTGMTGSFVVPGVMFLQAIGLPRDLLIQAMGILFTVSTVALAMALQQHSLLTAELGLLSLLGVVPALAGMWLGQQLRQHLSEQRFRKIFFYSLLFLGCCVLISAYR